MTLKDVKNWLKTQIDCPFWYIGKIDGSKEQAIGLYNTQSPAPNIAVGGIENTTYTTKSISILVHWTKNADTAEIKAKEIFDKFFGQTAIINNQRVIQFNMRTSEPIDVGTDDQGFYEYVIPLSIIYEK